MAREKRGGRQKWETTAATAARAERLSDSRAERRTTNSDVKTAGKKLRAAKVKGGMGGMGRWEEIAVCK